jgi:hypothetical protein
MSSSLFLIRLSCSAVVWCKAVLACCRLVVGFVA